MSPELAALERVVDNIQKYAWNGMKAFNSPMIKDVEELLAVVGATIYKDDESIRFSGPLVLSYQNYGREGFFRIVTDLLVTRRIKPNELMRIDWYAAEEKLFGNRHS